jgi:hypothetical protein
MNLFWTVLLAIGWTVEVIAIVTKHYAWTFSEFIWRVCDVLPGQTIWQWRFIHLLLLVFMLWLTIHLAFRIWR